MSYDLTKELNYYIENQDELVAKYSGKVLAIKGLTVIGVYDDDFEAVEQTSKDHELGTFLVQRCGEGTENYSQTYHTRVAFL